MTMSDREIRNAERAYHAATQGMVLLKNDNDALPLKKEGKVALFGVGAVRTVRGGTGSGDPFNGGLSGGGRPDIDQSPKYNIHVLDAFVKSGYEVVTESGLRDYALKYDEAKAASGMRPLDTFAYPEIEYAEAELKAAALQTDTAVYVLSRNAGEGADRQMTKIASLTPPKSPFGARSEKPEDGFEVGDYLLSKTELENLKTIKETFKKTVLVLNVGGNVDLTQVCSVDSILLMGQAGQEGGRAARDVLNGTVNPSGKLTSTWAKKYSDYPASATFALNDGNADLEKYEEGIFVGYRYFDSFGIEPLYPFGFGKSYTTFDVRFVEAKLEGTKITVVCEVKNTGKVPGKEVVQVYFSAPESELEMPAQELIAFGKTKELAPGEAESLTVEFLAASLASFDDRRPAYILSKGEFVFSVGNSSRSNKEAFVLDVPETVETELVRIELPLKQELKEISAKGKPKYRAEKTDGCPRLRLDTSSITTVDSRSPYFDEAVTTYTTNKNYRAVMPYEKVEFIEKREIKLIDVFNGKATLEEMVAQMTSEELAALNCGTGWGVADQNNPMVGGSSESVPGAAGETTHALKESYGVPSIVLADGPGGLRLAHEFKATDIRTGEKVDVFHYSTAWPVGVNLAQSFDTEVLYSIGEGFVEEMEEFGIAIVLGPGMDIMRDPLCGRNFEYFTEDPRLSGALTIANVKGIQSKPGFGACIKHYAANNQETNRNKVDTWINQRCLREIYLKPFEIAVKGSQPMSIMSSYNLINEIPTADSYDLCTDFARGEWGFKGLIMTDWNGGSSTPSISMHAGNDLIMPGGSVRALNIRLAMETVMPSFDERGQVCMDKPMPFLPVHVPLWNSFTPDKDGGDIVVATVAAGKAIEIKDGVVYVDGSPVFTKANGFKEMMELREKFVPFAEPLTTEMATVQEQKIIYKGTVKSEKTICLGDVQKCAINNLRVIMNSVAMKQMYPEVELEAWA